MVRLLDCTLRDGSHVNTFSDECILDTLSCAENSGINYIEVGYVKPECIKHSKIKTVLMVDAKSLPVNLEECDIDCVRVACYPHQIQEAIRGVEDYKKQGFEVFLHLMTADKFEDYELLKNWNNKNILNSIYFADTYGAFMPSDVEKIYKKIKNCGFEKISFHAHNNLQLAFSNTIKAIELGAYSVDVSAFGMGRGGGNLPAEVLLRYLDKNTNEYLELIKKHYLKLYNQTPWGYGFDALICGLKNIHPSQANV